LQQFAHVASHDLKEPLRKIKTFAGLLADDGGTKFSERAATYLNKIDTASSRMFTMIDGVLNYSTLNETEQSIEKVDLNETMRNITSDLEVVMGQKKAQLLYDKLPVIEGASVLLHQLFYNLVNNSLKFARADAPPLITIASSPVVKNDKSFVQIRIIDNGIGFQQEFAKRIFETFTRLNSKDQYEGTGLGLSLCKRIVERHGGSIEAFGQPGKGAEFVILLPTEQERVSF
jgi:light-regulated signal transduction histidine kinase (bacteriophytochrome)